MKSILNLLAAFALSGSALLSPAAFAQNASAPAPAQAASGPIKQPDQYGCGPAAAANCVAGGLLYYQGVCAKLPDPSVVNTPREGWNGSGGVTRWELCSTLQAFDKPSNWTLNSDGTLQDLKDICANGGKAVVLIPGTPTKPGHFVTACAVTGNKKPEVTVIDPADGKKHRRQLSPPYVIIYPK